jgi:hypothetical protein
VCRLVLLPTCLSFGYVQVGIFILSLLSIQYIAQTSIAFTLPLPWGPYGGWGSHVLAFMLLFVCANQQRNGTSLSAPPLPCLYTSCLFDPMRGGGGQRENAKQTYSNHKGGGLGQDMYSYPRCSVGVPGLVACVGGWV